MFSTVSSVGMNNPFALDVDLKNFINRWIQVRVSKLTYFYYIFQVNFTELWINWSVPLKISFEFLIRIICEIYKRCTNWCIYWFNGHFRSREKEGKKLIFWIGRRFINYAWTSEADFTPISDKGLQSTFRFFSKKNLIELKIARFWRLEKYSRQK